jgi:hypothetical protein
LIASASVVEAALLGSGGVVVAHRLAHPDLEVTEAIPAAVEPVVDLNVAHRRRWGPGGVAWDPDGQPRTRLGVRMAVGRELIIDAQAALMAWVISVHPLHRAHMRGQSWNERQMSSKGPAMRLGASRVANRAWTEIGVVQIGTELLDGMLLQLRLVRVSTHRWRRRRRRWRRGGRWRWRRGG